MFEQLLSTGLSMAGNILGVSMQNEANAQAASHQREWAGDQERSGREFTERMSSTAHQREAKDLEAAGLNPLLTLGGGASTPGASAPGGATAQVAGLDTNGMINSALQGLKLSKELDMMDAQIKKTKIDSKVAGKGIPASEITNEAYETLGKPLMKMLKGIFKSGSSSAKDIKNIPAVKGYDQKTKQFILDRLGDKGE